MDSEFTLFGIYPSVVAEPDSIEAAQQVVRDARGAAIVPWGGGTRQHVGYPPARYDLAFSARRLDAITEYAPADLTVTAQAGVTLAALQSRLAQHGQWLPLEVACPERQTMGGLVAARPASLTRAAFGSVRDSLIGVKVVNASGDLVVGGGKVVKNVSGYDLPKLYCGSWGTLGFIAEATFKVAPLPEASALALLPLPSERNAEDALDMLFESGLQPSLTFLLNAQAARVVLNQAEEAQYLLVGFDGPAEAVTWQIAQLGTLPMPPKEAEAIRRRLRDFPVAEAAMTARFHILPSQVGAFARMLEWTARRAGFTAQVASDAACGIVHVQVNPENEPEDWGRFYADFADKALRVGGSCTIERMPPELRELDAPVWSPLLADFALMAGVKKALDPEGLWNPGRFVGRL